MSDGMTVVLGWDGLDYELVEEFGLADEFGVHSKELETFDNDVLGKPHTYEVWPSIITGLPPEQHGIYAATESDGVAWDSDVLATVASLSRYCIPDGLRTRVGALLRERGAGLDFKAPTYYRDESIETVFDERTSRAITIPNYRVDQDDDLGLVYDRGADLGEFLNVGNGEEGETVHKPKTSLPKLEERLISELTSKLGAVRATIQREYDLVFVWLGYLDTVGHLEPTVDAAGWQERAYLRAARLTENLRSTMQPEDTLICVSDHGLQNGHHTHNAFIGSSDEHVLDEVQSVLDVRDGIELVTPASGTVEDPPIREAFRYDNGGKTRGDDDVRDQLENLGYI